MEGITFRLSGKTAMFKKPDVNSNVYLTYHHIHRVALLGLIGAVLGYEGLNHQLEYNRTHEDRLMYPVYYEKLQNLKIGITPLSDKGYFSKKLQIYNNSVGYASKEEGGNLIVKEFWLENPAWQIYLYTDDEELKNVLMEYLIGKKCVYTPYLGKNDHLADITDVKLVSVSKSNQVTHIHSLVTEDIVDFGMMMTRRGESVKPYRFKESLPIGLVPYDNIYRYQTFVYTNQPVATILEPNMIYTWDDKNIYMF